MSESSSGHRVHALLLVVSVVAVGLLAFAPQSQAQTSPINFFRTLGDRVHLSSTPPPTLSAHGWWRRISGPARLAKVTVQIQQRHNGGFVSVGARGVRIVRSGGGAGNRATARARCHHYRGGSYTYRSVVDVDIVGHKDTPEKLYTNWATGSCSYLGRDA